MRKGLWSTAALVTLVAGALVLASPALQAADNRVAMGSSDEPLKFLPAEITVPVGTKVEWFNDTDLQHDVSAEDGSFDSKGLLGKGQKYEFTFSKAGEFKYFCTPHKDAGMKGVVKVTGAGAPAPAPATPTAQASTTTTAPSPGAPNPVTARAGASASSTTTMASSTTTTAGSGVTSTTLAPSVTPTSGPDVAAETTTTTTAAGGGGEAAADDHSSEGGHEKKEKKKNSPIGIAFATLSTLLLAGISGKLLASKP